MNRNRMRRLPAPRPNDDFGGGGYLDQAAQFVTRVIRGVAVPANRRGWSEARYEQQMKKDARAQKRLANALKKSAARVERLERANTELRNAPAPAHSRMREVESDEDEDSAEGWFEDASNMVQRAGRGLRAQPGRRGSSPSGGLSKVTSITPSLSVNTRPGVNVGIVDLGNGVFLAAEVPQTNARPDQIRIAIEDGALIALGAPSKAGGKVRGKARGSWLALLGIE